MTRKLKQSFVITQLSSQKNPNREPRCSGMVMLSGLNFFFMEHMAETAKKWKSRNYIAKISVIEPEVHQHPTRFSLTFSTTEFGAPVWFNMPKIRCSAK